MRNRTRIKIILNFMRNVHHRIKILKLFIIRALNARLMCIVLLTSIIAFRQPRFFYDRQTMLQTYLVADTAQSNRRTLEILKLAVAVQIDGVENNVSVRIFCVCVSCDYKLMLAFRPAQSKLNASGTPLGARLDLF